MAGWTRVEEILAYQRSVELRDKVLALLDSGAIPCNYHLRDQIADAARSAPANIAEGFARYKHGQFGYHVGVAQGSLAELDTHFEEVRSRGFLSKKVLDEIFALIGEAYRLTNGLLRHLKTTEAPAPWLKPAPPTPPASQPESGSADPKSNQSLEQDRDTSTSTEH